MYSSVSQRLDNQERFWTINGLNLFQDLPEKAIRERTLKTVELDRYQQIRYADELGEVVYLIREGRVKFYTPAEDSVFDDESSEEQKHTVKAEQATQAVVETGEIFGEVPTDPVLESQVIAESINPTDLVILPRWEFNLLLQKYPRLNLWIRKWIPLRKVSYPLDCIAARSVSSRLAFFLIKLAETKGRIEQGVLKMKPGLSRTQMAQLIGTDVGLVDQYLEELDHRQIIELKWGKISIPDQWRLKRVADNRQQELEITKEEEPDDLSFLTNPPPLPPAEGTSTSTGLK